MIFPATVERMSQFDYLTSAELTDVGRKRTSNEDAILMLPEQGVFCVADGMGGAAHGEIASQWVVDALREAFTTGSDDDRIKNDRVRDAINVASRRIKNMASEGGHSGTGATVVILFFDDDHPDWASILHAGDSRAYRLRRGLIECLTVDHSMVTAAGSRGKPVPPIYRGMVTRAVGVHESVELEETPVEVEPGDIYLLCSDGLSSMLPDQRLRQLLQWAPDSDLNLVARELIEAAGDAGGDDNISVVLTRVGHVIPKSRRASPVQQDFLADFGLTATTSPLLADRPLSDESPLLPSSQSPEDAGTSAAASDDADQTGPLSEAADEPPSSDRAAEPTLDEQPQATEWDQEPRPAATTEASFSPVIPEPVWLSGPILPERETAPEPGEPEWLSGPILQQEPPADEAEFQPPESAFEAQASSVDEPQLDPAPPEPVDMPPPAEALPHTDELNRESPLAPPLAHAPRLTAALHPAESPRRTRGLAAIVVVLLAGLLILLTVRHFRSKGVEPPAPGDTLWTDATVLAPGTPHASPSPSNEPARAAAARIRAALPAALASGAWGDVQTLLQEAGGAPAIKPYLPEIDQVATWTAEWRKARELADYAPTQFKRYLSMVKPTLATMGEPAPTTPSFKGLSADTRAERHCQTLTQLRTALLKGTARYLSTVNAERRSAPAADTARFEAIALDIAQLQAWLNSERAATVPKLSLQRGPVILVPKIEANRKSPPARRR